jgi:ADP-ribose pyrophosphatase YjhB (NUDIX family)
VTDLSAIAAPPPPAQPSAHLRWLRDRVPGERLFAPRLALALETRDGRVVVDGEGQLPAVELEIGGSLAESAAIELERLGLGADLHLAARHVRTGPQWWEEHSQLGPLQPIWCVLAGRVDHADAARASLRPAADLPLLSAPVDRVEPSAEPGPIQGGDYVHRVRSRIGHDPIFYPWAGLALRDPGRRVFLVRLREGAQWHCPGGGMEIGERPEDTAARELREETGMLARPGRLIGCYSERQRTFENGDHIQAIGILMEGDLVGADLRADETNEIDQVGWYRVGRLPDLQPPWAGRVMTVLTGEGRTYD